MNQPGDGRWAVRYRLALPHHDEDWGLSLRHRVLNHAATTGGESAAAEYA